MLVWKQVCLGGTHSPNHPAGYPALAGLSSYDTPKISLEKCQSPMLKLKHNERR
jgi:hypothetical protein